MFAALFTICVFLLPAQLSAAQPPSKIEASCHRVVEPGVDAARVLKMADGWDCADTPSLAPARTILRFAPGDAEGAPDRFVMRRAEFRGLTLFALGQDGTIALRAVTLDDFAFAGIDGFVSVPLPAMTDAKAYYALFDRPVAISQLTRSHLAAENPAAQQHRFWQLLLVAAICGMLIMPLVFDFAFWRVLRERFLVWHTALAMAMMVCVGFTSGLFGLASGLPTSVISTITTFSFGLVVSFATMFGHAFIEPGKLHPGLRRIMPASACAALCLSAAHAAFPFALRDIHLTLYMIGYIPVVTILIASMANALIRGSRAAWFQAIGWGPLLLTGLIRQFTHLAPLQAQDAMTLFYAGCAFEVVATAVGIADRLLMLRRQRDDAVTSAAEMKRLSSRDPLTGLLNRRAVEPQFAQLRAKGFDTLALIDLDRFKDVNDRFGHQTGDRVLAISAQAIRGEDNEDCIAVRLGGEEFMLLLRGKDTRERAERLRQSIPIRVAGAVPDLDRPVTASMGVIEIPRDGFVGMDFAELYERADKLLYQAKAAGRNRTVVERIKLFGPAGAKRRARRKAAA
jgi:diguanylate cyclase (GGDEF)-like protein